MTRRDDIVDGLTRSTLAFTLASRAVRKPDVRVPHRYRTLRELVQGITRTGRPFRQQFHLKGVIKSHLVAAELEYYDLNGCDLSDFRLAEADLRRAYLRNADLQHASLFRCILESADLTGARLRRADLREANLGAACLVRADMRGARLDGASLRNADLRGARLAGADFSNADLLGARLDDDFDRTTVKSDRATRWPEAAVLSLSPSSRAVDRADDLSVLR
jgi:hypothetical protein